MCSTNSLAVLVTLGSFLGGLVCWVQSIAAFTSQAPARAFNYTRFVPTRAVHPRTEIVIATEVEPSRQVFVRNAGPKPRTMTTTAAFEEMKHCSPVSVIDTYVINMDDQPERYNKFLDHLTEICGLDVQRVHRHSGVAASTSLIDEEWVQELIPGIKQEAAFRLGSLGLALAHLTLWVKIGRSDRCQLEGGQDGYALIFEDDERPRAIFADSVNQVLRLVNHFPNGSRPDFINLNVMRPSGRSVANLGVPQKQLQVLEVQKKHRQWRTGPLCGDLHCNVWMSAYLVRCGAIPNLIRHGGRYPDGEHIYNGVTPTFDRQMSDVQSDGRTPVRGWSISPRDSISLHNEGFDARKKRDAEAARQAKMRGSPPILNSKSYVNRDFEADALEFEWH